MKNLLAIIFTLTLMATGLSAQTADAAKVDPWTKYMTPDEVHKLIAQYDGEWALETTIWMEPGKPPVKLNLTTANKMTLGGRYLASTMAGDAMGVPYEGASHLGYNTISKKFTLVTLNNMSTGIMTLTGEWKVPQKSIELRGEVIAPDTGETIKVRQVMAFIDKDNYSIESFDTFKGKPEVKTVEYRFKRKIKN